MRQITIYHIYIYRSTPLPEHQTHITRRRPMWNAERLFSRLWCGSWSNLPGIRTRGICSIDTFYTTRRSICLHIGIDITHHRLLNWIFLYWRTRACVCVWCTHDCIHSTSTLGHNLLLPLIQPPHTPIAFVIFRKCAPTKFIRLEIHIRRQCAQRVRTFMSVRLLWLILCIAFCTFSCVCQVSVCVRALFAFNYSVMLI